jgi:hypothetical protein
MYECVIVQSYLEEDSILNEEGELDNESDDSEFDVEVRDRRRESNNSDLTSSSMVVDECMRIYFKVSWRELDLEGSGKFRITALQIRTM